MKTAPSICHGLGLTLLALVVSGLGLTAAAETVVTVPVGAVTLEALANSDSYISIPLVRPPIFGGVVESKSGNALTLKGANFVEGELQYQSGIQPNTYYLQIASGSAVGQSSTVLANTNQVITCDYEQDILDSLQVGDRVVIRPYWTLSTLFPAEKAGSYFEASSSNVGSGRKTEIIFPDVSSQGINKSAASVYFFNSYWRRSGSVTVDRSDVIVPPDTYIVVRGNGYLKSTKLVVVGVVQDFPNAVSLLSLASGKNDNPVGMLLPCPKALQDLNLAGDGGVFASSTSNVGSGRGDELIVLDNTLAAKNKSASAVYFYNSYWRKSGNVTVNQNATTLPAGSAIVIRKKQTGTAQVSDWSQPPAYTAN